MSPVREVLPCGDVHTLLITEDGPEIIHPGCPFTPSTYYRKYNCVVDSLIENMGYEGAFNDKLPDDLGEYQIQAMNQEYYSFEYGSYEYDTWIEIINV